MNETIRSMTDNGTVDIHFGPYQHTNDIQVNLGLSCDVPFVPYTSQNPGCIGILLSHHHAHYTEIFITGFVLFSRYCVPASS